jgi:hypothetical protein
VPTNPKWRPFALLALFCLLSTASAYEPPRDVKRPPRELYAGGTKAAEDVDVSWKAKDEIARRGPMVERINGFEADSDQAYFVEAIAPPADDSNKWNLTLVTTKNCSHCERLRGDFDQAPALAPWVNTKDYTKSWAHYQVVQIDDKSQSWRWKDFKPKSFPTLILQPPFDQSWGDPHTIVMLVEGYETPEKLAQKMRAAIDQYAKKVKPQRQAWKSRHSLASNPRSGGGMESEGMAQQGGWTPPATPPSVLPPAPYTPQTIPPTPATDPTPAVANDTTALVFTILGWFLPDTKTWLLLLTAVSNVWLLIRDRRQQSGLPLLLDNATAAKLVEFLKTLGTPSAS